MSAPRTPGAPRAASPQSINDVRDWYEACVESLAHHRAAVRAALRAGTPTESRFLGMTAADVDAHFAALRRNLDLLTIVDLIATGEAALRADYRRRLDRGRRDALSQAYRAFHRSLRTPQQRRRPPFDEHGILDALRDSAAVDRHLVTDFRDALRLRHWIAHGRYWKPSLDSAAHAPDDVYRTINALLTALPT